jgi:anti-sigma factor ChrR (cupin superfamily)
VNPHRLQDRLDSVPESLDASQRARLAAHRSAVEECRERIAELRAELRRVLSGIDGPRSSVEIMIELDGLERVQQRLDSRLSDLCDELTGTAPMVHYGDAAPN